MLGRENTVFRVTGMQNVTGSCFLTVGIAFTACAMIAVSVYSSAVVKALSVIVAVFILIKNNITTKQKDESDYEEQLFGDIMNAKDKAQCWELLKNVCATQQEMRVSPERLAKICSTGS